MKIFKLLIATLICAVLTLSQATAAYAKETGVVDLTKVLENYTFAQEVSADLNVKKAELEKFVVEAQEKIKKSASPVEKKNIEEKLSEQFNIKRNAFAKEQAEKWQQVEDKVFEQIKQTASGKKLDMVLNKQSVIVGGEDITEEVIKKLNDAAKKK